MGSESFDLHFEFGLVFLGAKIWKLLFEDTVVAICFFFKSNCSDFFAMSMQSKHAQ